MLIIEIDKEVENTEAVGDKHKDSSEGESDELESNVKAKENEEYNKEIMEEFKLGLEISY